MTNLNEFAVRVTELEGKKVSLPIGQVKEVVKITLQELKVLSVDDLIKLLARIK